MAVHIVRHHLRAHEVFYIVINGLTKYFYSNDQSQTHMYNVNEYLQFYTFWKDWETYCLAH